MTNCSVLASEYASCLADLENVSTLYSTMSGQFDACGCGVDPCAISIPVFFDQPLHIASVFIILVASAIGCAIPVGVKYLQAEWAYFAILLGKCTGTGVVLACGFIHMLQPSAQSLTSPCVPWEFNTDYNAYAFLYAMLAGIVMQFLDFLFTEYAISVAGAKPTAANDKIENSDAEEPAREMHDLGNSRTTGDPHTGHFHPTIKMDGTKRKMIEAYMIEFGVTTHSVFIGLAVGVVDFTTLQSLLTALCFHQFFEGVALGARISDAKFPHLHEFGLTLIFSIAAPIGIAVGIAVVTTMNVNGETFLLIQGTFDGICGGILIYLGYSLLLIDFPADIANYCRGKPNENYRKAAMYGALCLGAGLMAFIGKYL